MKEEKNKQLALFDMPEWWEEHWVGMPEFNQKDLTPWKSIYIHFETRKDMEEFAKLVGQEITERTQSIWFPKAKIGKTAGKIYTTKGYKDES